MISLSVALVILGVLAYRLGDRLVTIKERTQEALIASQKPLVSGKVPDDIAGLAALYSDEWARDSFLARAQELYEKTNDWGQVRLLLEGRAE